MAVLLMEAATACAAVSLMSAIAMRAPSRAKVSAMPLPNPDAPPVMSATLFSSRMRSSPLRSAMARRNSIRTRPAQAVLGTPARFVFASYPFAVTDTVKHGEDLRIIHLAFVRLAPSRNGGDLHVADERKILFEAFDQIAADDLRMIEVELNAHIWPLKFGNDVGRLLDPAEEIIRPIARVKRLDQQGDVALARRVGSASEIAQEGALRSGPLLRRHRAGETMDLAAADRSHIVERLVELGRELLLLPWYGGKSGSACR